MDAQDIERLLGITAAQTQNPEFLTSECARRLAIERERHDNAGSRPERMMARKAVKHWEKLQEDITAYAALITARDLLNRAREALNSRFLSRAEVLLRNCRQSAPPFLPDDFRIELEEQEAALKDARSKSRAPFIFGGKTATENPVPPPAGNASRIVPEAPALIAPPESPKVESIAAPPEPKETTPVAAEPPAIEKETEAKPETPSAAPPTPRLGDTFAPFAFGQAAPQEPETPAPAPSAATETVSPKPASPPTEQPVGAAVPPPLPVSSPPAPPAPSAEDLAREDAKETSDRLLRDIDTAFSGHRPAEVASLLVKLRQINPKYLPHLAARLDQLAARNEALWKEKINREWSNASGLAANGNIEPLTRCLSTWEVELSAAPESVRTFVSDFRKTLATPPSEGSSSEKLGSLKLPNGHTLHLLQEPSVVFGRHGCEIIVRVKAPLSKAELIMANQRFSRRHFTITRDQHRVLIKDGSLDPDQRRWKASSLGIHIQDELRSEFVVVPAKEFSLSIPSPAGPEQSPRWIGRLYTRAQAWPDLPPYLWMANGAKPDDTPVALHLRREGLPSEDVLLIWDAIRLDLLYPGLLGANARTVIAKPSGLWTESGGRLIPLFQAPTRREVDPTVESAGSLTFDAVLK